MPARTSTTGWPTGASAARPSTSTIPSVVGSPSAGRAQPAREVYLVQRKTSVIGKDLGKTSGWAHRAVLKQSGVEQISGASYERIDERGLHLIVDGEPRLLEVDDVVVCAGQESVRTLYDDLERADRTPGCEPQPAISSAGLTWPPSSTRSAPSPRG